MNRDDIISMAREAQFSGMEICGDHDCDVVGSVDDLERFAALVIRHKALDQITSIGQYEKGFDDGAAAEREECAKVIEEWIKHPHLAMHIRARGQA